MIQDKGPIQRLAACEICIPLEPSSRFVYVFREKIQEVGEVTLSSHFNFQLDSKNPPNLYTMQWKALFLALVAEHGAAQFERMPMLRFSCSQLVVERLDPLVSPGMKPSPHVHQIVGKCLSSLLKH